MTIGTDRTFSRTPYALGRLSLYLSSTGACIVDADGVVLEEATEHLVALIAAEDLQACRLIAKMRSGNVLDRLDGARALSILLGLPIPPQDSDPKPPAQSIAGVKLDYDRDRDKIHALRLPDLCTRAMTELHGIAHPVMYDGKVDDTEIDLLREWVRSKQEFLDAWPLSELNAILGSVFADGKVTEDERGELAAFLSSIAAAPAEEGRASERLFTVSPNVTFVGRVYLITGKLSFAGRKQAWALIQQAGGETVNSPGQRVNYLVIGDLGSDDWKFSRYGRKIEAIKEMQERGQDVQIIGEHHLLEALRQQGVLR